MTTEFTSTNTASLTKQDIINAAKELQCEPAAIQAVCQVEAPNGGFIVTPNAVYKDCPTLLFESHKFSALTMGQYDSTHPGISTPTWVHNYGPGGDHQYQRLMEAISLNREAALKSASWGKFQICGFNFYNAGSDNIEEFVKNMISSEAGQLDAFISFLANTGIDEYLKNKNWSHFALSYNGNGQVAKYASSIQQAYQEAVRNGWNK